MSGLLNTQRAWPSGPVALVERGVAVQRRGPHVREVELGECPQLVGGQRLGRREVEGGGARVGGERGEHRQLVGQRLPGRRAGRHHDVLPGVGQLGRVHLVGPGGAHAVVDQRVADRRGHPVRPRRDAPGPRGHPHDVPQRGGLGAARRAAAALAAVALRARPRARLRPPRPLAAASSAAVPADPPRRCGARPGDAVRRRARARQHAAQQVGTAPLRGSVPPAHGHRAHGHRGWHTLRCGPRAAHPFGQTRQPSRGMSRRCHEQPPNGRDDQGADPPSSVMQSVTRAGARVPPERPARSRPPTLR